MKSYEVRSWGIARTESGVCINGLCVETSDLWHSSEIVERKSSNSLVTSSGNEYKLVGPMSYSSCSEKYFSTSFLKKFEDGFPENWKDLLMSCSKINKKTRKRSHEKYVKDMTNKKIKLDAEYPPCFLTSSPMPLQSPPPFRPVDKSKINKVYKSQLFPTNSDRINSTQKESHRHNSEDLDDQMSSEEMNSQNSNPPPENIFQDISVDILATSFGDCEIDEDDASPEELMNDGSIFEEPISKTIHKKSTTSRSKRNRKNHTKVKSQEDDDDGGGSDDYSSTILSKRRRTDILDDDSLSDDDVCAVEPSLISLSSSSPPSSDELENIKSGRARKNSKNNQKLSMKKKTKVVLQRPCIVAPKKKTTATKTGKVKKKGDGTSKKPVKNESKGTTSSQNKNETNSQETKQSNSRKTAKKLPNETSKTNKQQKTKPVAATSKAGKGKENLLEGHELLGGRPTLKKSRLLKKMMTEQLKSDENGQDFLADMTQENVQDEDAIKVMAMFDGDTLDNLGQQSNLTSSWFNKSMSNKSTMSSAAPSRLNETTAMMLTRSPQNARDTELEIFRLNKIMKKRNMKPADDSQQKPLTNKYLTELPDEVFIMDEGGDGEDSERDNYFSESEMS